MKQVVLYNHNKTTYENIVRIFENDNKCAAVQPTGSGKSFLIFKLAQDNSDKTIVVFEPNKQIIGRVSEQMKEYGIENIKFYTYQKLNSQHKRDEISIDNVDYICLDELHRIKAKQWGQAVEAIQDKFPNAKVLGLTATPERMDGQNIIDYFGAELACNITLGDAIVNKILPCPTYISALYTFDEEVQRVYDKINESRNSDEEKEEMRAELETAKKQLENALGVPKILEKHIPDKNGKYIVFCQNVEHLNTMQSVIEDWFVSAGFEIHTYAVHTKNPNRKAEYKAFQTDNADCIKLCLCVDMLNEGVHLEGITGVILLRPTQSSIIYLQQIGRAISASNENTPIIFDLVNNGSCLGSINLKIEIESAVYKQQNNKKQFQNEDTDIFNIGDFHIYDYVTESLNILNNIENKCVNDFDFRLKQLEEYKNKWGHCCVMKEEAQEWKGLHQWAKFQREHFNKNGLSQYRLKVLNEYEFIWNVNYWRFDYIIVPHIKQYINDGNKLPIPYKYICKDGFTLGTHLNTFRKQKHNNKIDKYIENQLLQLGIDLDLKTLEEQWEVYYNLCYEYIYLLGNKINSKTEYKGYKIGAWVITNRRHYLKNNLSIERKKLFENINCFHKSKDDIWIDTFNVVKEYKQFHKEPITQQTEYKGYKIGAWLNQNKVKYFKGKLSKNREELLKEIYALDSIYDKLWDEKYKLLEEYINFEHGKNITIPYKLVYKNTKLGNWYFNQLKLYRQGCLNINRIKKLELLGLLNPPKKNEWEDLIKTLKEYFECHSQLNSNTIYKNIKIGSRVNDQKKRYKKGKLSKKRYQQLLDLGIDLAKEGSIM